MLPVNRRMKASRVLLVDVDPQGSATWWAERAGDRLPFDFAADSDPAQLTRLRRLELLEKLPEGSEARTLMLDHVAAQTRRLTSQQTGSRDLPTFVVSLLAAPVLGLLAIYLWQRGHWWGVPLAVFVGLLGVIFMYGIFESGQRVPRDAKGKRVSPWS